MARTDRPAARGRRSGAQRPSRSRRSVDEMSRRGIATCSTSPPVAGRPAYARRSRSTTTSVARSRVSSSRRHVGMLATASAPSTQEQLAPGAASASSVSAVTDGAPRSTSIARPRRRRLRRPRPPRARGGRAPTRRPGRASATGHRRRRAAPGRARARRGPRSRPRRGRRAPDRTCRRTRRAARCHRPGSLRARPSSSLLRNTARHLRP